MDFICRHNTQACIDVVIRTVDVINLSIVKHASNKTQSTNWLMAGCMLKEGVNANIIAKQLQLCGFLKKMNRSQSDVLFYFRSSDSDPLLNGRCL